MNSHKHDGHSHGHEVPPETPVDAAFVRVNDPAPAATPTMSPLSDESRHAVRKLLLVTAIALIFMMMEFIGGYIAGSLAVISDAVHMLTDVLGFVISLTAIWIGRKPASDRLSFGFHRVEIVGAMVSIMVIWVLTGILLYSAVLRFADFLEEGAEQVVDGKTMFIIAFIGLVMNVVMMKVLGGHGHGHGLEGHGHSHGHSHAHGSHDLEDGHAEDDHEHGDHAGDGHGHGHSHGSHGHTEDDHADEDDHVPKKKPSRWSKLWGSKFENLNIQAAYLHVLGDLLQSVGVTIAGAVIWWKPDWQLADPIMTFVFSILVIATTLSTVKESLRILMEGTPRGVEPSKIESGLRACTSVVAVHDLHIWSLNTNKPALAVHLVSNDPDAALASAQNYLIGKGITHTTIQIERPATAYPQVCAEGGRCT